jgi:hypothetical protein
LYDGLIKNQVWTNNKLFCLPSILDIQRVMHETDDQVLFGYVMNNPKAAEELAMPLEESYLSLSKNTVKLENCRVTSRTYNVVYTSIELLNIISLLIAIDRLILSEKKQVDVSINLQIKASTDALIYASTSLFKYTSVKEKYGIDGNGYRYTKRIDSFSDDVIFTIVQELYNSFISEKVFAEHAYLLINKDDFKEIIKKLRSNEY